MAKLHKQIARKDIWTNGIKTTNSSLKQGYTWDRSQPENDKDVLLIGKGQEYFWWQHRDGIKHISLTEPEKWEIASQDGVLYEVYHIEKELEGIEADSLQALQETVKDIYKRLWKLHNGLDDFIAGMPLVLQDVGEGGQANRQKRAVYGMLSKIKKIKWPLVQDDRDEWWEKTIPILRTIQYSEE